MKNQDNKNRPSFLRWFGSLPPWVKGVACNCTVLALLGLIFFLCGNYMYGPAKTARAYYEARLAKDWNTVYDCCVFPKSSFLSRQNFVNANDYDPESGGEGGQKELPEITSYMMRKKGNEGGKTIYQINYSLKDDGEAHIEKLLMERGSTVLWFFSNWQVSPEDMYVADVNIAVPAKARLVLDGSDVTGKYKVKSSDSEKDIYQIPYLFLGWHTVELKESGKENYREVFELKEKRTLEFIPELQLNNKSGKEICERAEKAVDMIYQTAASHGDFKDISEYFFSDSKTQKAAEKAFGELSEEFSTSREAGIATLSVTRVTTSVKNQDDVMSAGIDVVYTAEKVNRWLFFFYKTKTYSDSVELKANVLKEDGQWVFDEGIIGL